VPVKFVDAGIACRSGAPILTIRLALEAGPVAQFEFVAPDVWPESAAPVASAVPIVWPDVAAHSTA